MAAVEHGGAEAVYHDASVRTMASDSTAGNGSWVGGRKRDWDNAFLAKFSDLEATLQENDRWLALYLDNIAGLKDTKRSGMAITAALKTTTTKRRSRSRIDIRNVFAGSMREHGNGRLSPLVSQFSVKSQRTAKRRSSYYGVQGNTLSMMAQMAMMPPKSPYLTNVGLADAPPLPLAKKQQSAMSLRSQRSCEGADIKQSVPPLNRSNSAAVKTAEAVKRLQAISGSPPKTQPREQVQLATPPSSAVQPLSADKTPLMSPQRQTSTRFTPMPTLRDMLLSHHHSPTKPVAPPASNEQQQPSQQHYRTQPSSQSSRQSSPEPVRAKAARSTSVTSSEGEQELSRNEEDVRERLQRVWIALGRPMGSITEQPEDAQPHASDKMSEAAELSLEQADLSDLCREIDEVEGMLPPSGDELQDGDSQTQDTSQSPSEDESADHGELPAGGPLSDVEIDQRPIDVRLDCIVADIAPDTNAPNTALEDTPPKRKHSEEEISDSQPRRAVAAVPSRLLAPTVSSLAKGRKEPAVRPPAPSGIPRKPALRTQASNSSMSSVSSQKSAAASKIGAPLAMHAANGFRVAEARRKFEGAAPKTTSAIAIGSTSVVTNGGGLAQYASPVAAMRPGYSSIVQTPAAAAQQKRVPGRQGPKTAQKSSTAAMREAARRAEVARTNSAASSARGQPLVRPKQPAGTEPLFKSVGSKPTRPGLRTQTSREQLQQQQQQRKPQARNSGTTDRTLSAMSGASAIPIPASSKGKEPAHDESSEPVDSSKWGLSSMLSMLSPSSWKSQESLVVDGPPPSMPRALMETPSAMPTRVRVASPYDVQSPQNPYQPRPEHGGDQGQLVMPAYQDVAVPLRRSSGRNSRSSLSDHRDSFSSATDSIPVQSFHRRLAGEAGGNRISGASSFRSSFFSDDDIGTMRTAGGSKVKRTLSMVRTQSTPDLPRQLQLEMVTPQNRPAGGRTSSIRSEEYTSIIPAGSNSPPEIESDYSDEYSDDEFSPAPKRKKNDFRIPRWATTPELMRGLENQARVNPDRIFGKVRPLRVNEIFNRNEADDARRRPRNSSMIWNGSDALTADDELAYIRRMGFDA
ncbi:hypothetical protein LPJ61_001271 [Coemansia biformis]|uniref:Inner centromere protein ARK-binding domain-containing protein n=1 Tax=Coemansia biformis TaxID=1286918 RepID=A0A9W7YH21_9FUNG|nr:hypothetical protein LPJ61_001271 [Coemansia biformis]